MTIVPGRFVNCENPRKYFKLCVNSGEIFQFKVNKQSIFFITKTNVSKTICREKSHFKNTKVMKNNKNNNKTIKLTSERRRETSFTRINVKEIKIKREMLFSRQRWHHRHRLPLLALSNKFARRKHNLYSNRPMNS